MSRASFSRLVFLFWIVAAWALVSYSGAGEKKEKIKEKVEKKEDKKKLEPYPFQELKYRSLGPAAGGRVSRACGVPGDPLTYYAATASGGVWKSTDAGFTWKPIFDDQPTSSIGAIAVAPSDANVVYVGSGEANIRGNVQPGNGIYKSTDGGKTWKHVWKQKGQIGQMIVHPKNPDIAYAAVLGSAFGPNPERGVYRTTDGGNTWKQVLTKVFKDPSNLERVVQGGLIAWRPAKEYVGAIDICMDTANSRILFACLWQARRTPWSLTSGGPGSGLHRSDDGGDTWKQLGPLSLEERKEADDKDALPPRPWGRCAVAVAPTDSRRIYVLIEGEKGGLYRSDDGGEKWTYVNPSRYLRIRPWYFSVITVDPANSDVVWSCGLRLLKSIDGGKTFRNVKGPHHVDHHDLWIDPKNPKRMIDSNDGGVDITHNGGETWYAPPLPISQFYHINVDNRVPYHVSGTMQDLGTASGPSNSLSSDGIGLRHWHGIGGGETGFTMPDPTDPNVVYAGEYGGYISRYDHRTRQARNMSIYPTNPSGHGAGDLRYRFQWTAPILISPHDPKTIYHGANVLFRTTDGGKTWAKVSGDLTRNDKSKQKWSGGPITGDNTTAEYYCTIFALAESPKKPGVLWAGSDDGLVHVSTDNGKTWPNVPVTMTLVTDKILKATPGFPDWATVCCIEASSHDAAVAYVVVDAHRLDDNRPYLFKTADYGKIWKSLARTLPQDDYIRVVREDPRVPGLLYIGTETGVSFSRDDGVTWERLKLNLPTVAVSDLKIKDNDLVVGTSGRSLWILDDLTPIRAWKPDLRGPHLFSAQPAYRYRYHSEVYGTEEKVVGDNPPKGAILHYVLEEKPKELTLDIFDAKGTKVRRFTSKKVEPDVKEDDPDAPWQIVKVPALPTEKGVNRFVWDLAYEGAKIIPGAKNDGGEPRRGPLVNPGVYMLKLTVDGKTLTGQVTVRMDPRVKIEPAELDEQLRFALQLRDDTTRLAQMVLDLRSVKSQLASRNALLKEEAKAADLVKKSQALSEKLDRLEAQFHNPKAEVTYDILAMKGGAKLYSQLALLYEWAKDSDGPITQGMREVGEDQRTELERLTRELAVLLTAELDQLNVEARSLQVPHIHLAPR